MEERHSRVSSDVLHLPTSDKSGRLAEMLSFGEAVHSCNSAARKARSLMAAQVLEPAWSSQRSKVVSWRGGGRA